MTRIPVRGYTHQVLCDHYFAQTSEEKRPLWYHTLVAQPVGSELYGRITATPDGISEPPLELKDKEQKPYGDCESSKSHQDMMSSFLPLVTLHADRPTWGDLDLIAIPVHSIHRWNSPTYGTFLGWLYVFRNQNGPLAEQELTQLQLLWPLLDSFAMEFIEGEIQDYLGHYQGDSKPLPELEAAIPRLSGWRVVHPDASVEPEVGDLATFSDDKLFVKVEVRGSPDDIIVLKPSLDFHGIGIS